MNKKLIDKKEVLTLPEIARYSSRAEWEAACWQKISESKKLIELLITSHERHDLIMRAAAVSALASGKSYKQIGNELWLSPQTISGIKKAMTENNYQSYLQRSKAERKKKVYSHIAKTQASGKKGARIHTKYGILRLP